MFRRALGALVLCAAPALASAPALPAAPSLAAAPAAPARLDPAALAAADRLLGAMDYQGMMQRTSDAVLQNMAPALKKAIEAKTGQAVDDELIRRIVVIQGEFMRSKLAGSADMRRAVATIYASRFSAAELDHLSALYKDPVMRKWSQVSPSATAELVPLVRSVMEARRPELEQRIKAAVLNYYAEQGKGPSS